MYSCLSHVVNLGSQDLISTYTKSPHYAPHDLKAHESDTWIHGNRDEIGLICAICVKVSHCLLAAFRVNWQSEQECSSAKQKELYKQIQIKANVVPLTQLLLDMKVRWSSTYVMINRAEMSKNLSLKIVDTVYWHWQWVLSMWIFLSMNWVCKTVTLRNVLR